MGVARDLGPRNITADVVAAGLLEGGMQPPDPETLKALVGSLSLQRMGHPDEIAAGSQVYVSSAKTVPHGRDSRTPMRRATVVERPSGQSTLGRMWGSARSSS
ncbi:hypothetical protein [Streptomyces shenzhenensis]|uniref:hypothetical protein n=1 Tax=Streptomyces shenzhenensis TaxID=943815 RepID=UPI0036959114